MHPTAHLTVSALLHSGWHRLRVRRVSKAIQLPSGRPRGQRRCIRHWSRGRRRGSHDGTELWGQVEGRITRWRWLSKPARLQALPLICARQGVDGQRIRIREAAAGASYTRICGRDERQKADGVVSSRDYRMDATY